jgi:hypothetical protein
MKNIILLLLNCSFYQPFANANGIIEMKDILNKDGSIKTCAGDYGAVDLSGFAVELDPCAGPVIKPVVAVEWSALGSGLGFTCIAIAIDASGNVYAGGNFTTAGGISANRIAKWDGSSWSALGSGLNSTVFAIAISGSDVYVGGGFDTAGGNSANYVARWEEAPLPIEWIAFEATAWEKRSALLTWRTASETQNAHFLVQHSTDGRAFQDLAKISGKGDSQVENHYEYLHENHSHGTNYYRLKQVDFDGQYEYSKIISVEIPNDKPHLTITPNPNPGQFTLHLQNPEAAPTTARLLDSWGRVVWVFSTEEGLPELQLLAEPEAPLTDGIYTLVVFAGQHQIMERVVVQRP